ncbi:MAG: hypothetical protein C5B52_02410 [Bacteroidetes bacterium]|nr:MAG: hypothetical protein C5B52_02410 [Bacteroidota bacterium]
MAVALLLSSFTLMANDNPRVDQKVENAFKKEFAGAEYVHWEKLNDAFQATFNFMGQRLIAYFSEDGDLLSTTRFIYSNQLPYKVVRELQEKYSSAEVNPSVLEAVYDSETVYFITVKDGHKEYLLKANSSGSISVANKKRLN